MRLPPARNYHRFCGYGTLHGLCALKCNGLYHRVPRPCSVTGVLNPERTYHAADGRTNESPCRRSYPTAETRADRDAQVLLAGDRLSRVVRAPGAHRVAAGQTPGGSVLEAGTIAVAHRPVRLPYSPDHETGIARPLPPSRGPSDGLDSRSSGQTAARGARQGPA